MAESTENTLHSTISELTTFKLENQEAQDNPENLSHEARMLEESKIFNDIKTTKTQAYCLSIAAIDKIGIIPKNWKITAYNDQQAEQTIDMRKILARLGFLAHKSTNKIKKKIPNCQLTAGYLLFSVAVHLAKVTWGTESKHTINISVPFMAGETLTFQNVLYDYVQELEIDIRSDLNKKLSPYDITRSRILAVYAPYLIDFFQNNIGKGKTIDSAETAPILYRKYMTDWELKFASIAFPNSFYGVKAKDHDVQWAFLFIMAYRQSSTSKSGTETVGMTKLLRVAQRRGVNFNNIIEHIKPEHLTAAGTNVMLEKVIDQLILNKPEDGSSGLMRLKAIFSNQIKK
jgi:hypothetical protein